MDNVPDWPETFCVYIQKRGILLFLEGGSATLKGYIPLCMSTKRDAWKDRPHRENGCGRTGTEARRSRAPLTEGGDARRKHNEKTEQ